MTKDPANFREYAGALIAFIICLAFIAIGFTTMAINVFHGATVQVPGDWMAAMLSLASAALGFLIGKQTTSPSTTTITATPATVTTTVTPETPTDNGASR